MQQIRRDTNSRGAIETASLIAAAMKTARLMNPPMTLFAGELSARLGRARLSRQAVYKWENGMSAPPATALLAAAEVTGLSLDELLHLARRRFCPGRRQSEIDARLSD